MRQHQSVLEFRHGRYLKLALVLCLSAIAAYAWHEPPAVYLKPYGGTWLGYTLGTIGAVLILWLMLLGVRKRRYRSNLGTLQGWTSAHVYLGTTLIVIATLHCAFEFGWNIHTLAYVLMLAVIASGFFGLYAYLRYPAFVTENLAGETLETMVLKIADLDRKCRRLALDLPDEVNAIIMKASRTTAREALAGGSFRHQLAGTAVQCPTRDACEALMHHATKQRTPQQAKVLEQLITEMTRKSSLTDRVRRDLRARALLVIWMYFHVPLSFALLAALIAHVVSVFYFW
jgi:hypothetical protein